MRILKEGHIYILPDGKVAARDFTIEGTKEELENLIRQRVELAANKLRGNRIVIPGPGQWKS